MHYVYMLLCVDNSLYTGYTNDLGRRVQMHNAKKGAKYTRGRTPCTLVYTETFAEKGAAMGREAAIKKLGRAKKLALIAGQMAKADFAKLFGEGPQGP